MLQQRNFNVYEFFCSFINYNPCDCNKIIFGVTWFQCPQSLKKSIIYHFLQKHYVICHAFSCVRCYSGYKQGWCHLALKCYGFNTKI